MKRAHRKSHLIFWLILGPIMAATLAAAVMLRAPQPVNTALPDALLEEAS